MTHHCELINGSFSVFIQLLLGFMALSSLLIKRKYFERSKRSRKIWLYDTSKQIIGQFFAHICNILIALILAEKKEDNDPCEWYLLNYILDTILGMFVCWLFVRLVNRISYRYNKPFLRSGNYRTGPGRMQGIGQYMIQLGVWISIIFTTKVLIFVLVLLPFKSLLQKLGDVMVHPLVDHPKAELVVVMIIVPLIMNSIQYWIQDTFLKDKKSNTSNTEQDNAYYYHIDEP